MYELYNPMIRDITVIKLEKRLDDDLTYLRDALPEYRCVGLRITVSLHIPLIIVSRYFHVVFNDADVSPLRPKQLKLFTASHVEIVAYHMKLDSFNSAVPFDLKPIPRGVNEAIPLNETKVKMKPAPWTRKWERKGYKVCVWSA